MGSDTLIAINNFKVFGIGAGANVTSQSVYEIFIVEEYA